MQGINVAEMGHVVNILPPVDINGGVNSDVFSLENYGHATIIIQIGVSAGTVAFTVEECDDFVPTTDTAIAFAIYKEETASGDTLGAKVAATTSGVTTSGNDNIFYVIEIDARELTDGYGHLIVKFVDPSASVIASAVAVLSGSRYGNDQSPTAIA
jgi:hypothetical protein